MDNSESKKLPTLEDVFKISLQRSSHWVPLEEWTAFEWAGALAGEAGEALNAAKKLRRLEGGNANFNVDPARHFSDTASAKRQIACEYADVLLYMPMCLARIGVSYEEFMRIVAGIFNKKSEEYGFVERI